MNQRQVFTQLIFLALLSGLVFVSGCGDDSATGSNAEVFSSGEGINSSSSEMGSSSAEISSSSGISYGTLTDPRDGKIYKTVVIGTQTWMAENLNYDAGTGSYCYDDDASNCAIYGRLYTWWVAMDACPDGWHLPSDLAWYILKNYVDANNGSDGVGYSLKTTSRWNCGRNGSNAFGFSGLPAGYLFDGRFHDLGIHGFWWSSGQFQFDNGCLWDLHYSTDRVTKSFINKRNAGPVRCLQGN